MTQRRQESSSSIAVRIASQLFRPFGIVSCVDRSIGSGVRTILDVGCGPGHFFQEATRRIAPRYSVGVDFFLPFLSVCKSAKTYDDVVLCDARALPFGKASFEAVLCTEVIEHLEKRDGIDLILQLEGLASQIVVISTPVGYLRECSEYDREVILQQQTADGLEIETLSSYQSPHLCGWSPDELRRRGYRVLGTSGHRFWRLRRTSRVSKLLIAIALPIVYLVPEIAFQMVASKRIRSDIHSED